MNRKLDGIAAGIVAVILSVSAFLYLDSRNDIKILRVKSELRSLFDRTIELERMTREFVPRDTIIAHLQAIISEIETSKNNLERLHSSMQREIAIRSGEDREIRSAIADSIAAVLAQNSERLAELKDRLRSEVTRIEEEIKRNEENLDDKRNLLSLVARVDGASGVVIQSVAGHTWILTAAHVVEDFSTTQTFGGKMVPVRILLDGVEIPLQGIVIAKNHKRDLALVKVKTEVIFPCARFADASPPLLSRVHAVGYPLGFGPYMTDGRFCVAKFKFKHAPESWLISSPSIFGNSGGGVFLEESGELIGLTVAGLVYQLGMSQSAVTHMAIVVPLSDITDWLDEVGLVYARK